MTASHRLVVVLACVLVACGDDAGVTTETDGSTGDEGTTDGTVTSPTTTINPSTSNPSTSITATETGTDTDDTTTDDTDTTTGEPDTTTTDEESSSSTSDGPECGDGVVNGTDECDGEDLDLQNCVALDFDGGDLACTKECTFDTSGCTMCGNATIEGEEECDGAEIGDATCASEGFVSGELACAGDCTFDTSGCTTCGNGMVDAGEDCDEDDLGGTLCSDLGVGFTGGTLACDASCGFVTTGCTNFALPQPGEVVITEIMQNPDTVADPDGEWFEVHNPGAATLQLGGCTVAGSDADNGFTIDADVEIAPGAYVIFGDDTALDPGFVADYEWPGADFSLANGADTVRLVCDGSMVDEVIYDDGGEFPDPTGASMNLDPGSFEAIANDDGANWCEAILSYNGDLGTPGAANSACDSETTYEIEFCRLQFPVDQDAEEGSDVSVFGRLFVGGLTDVTGMNDPAAEVIGYVGYGPDGTDPAVDATWVWSVGTPNVGYGPGSPDYEMNNDEYVATLTVPSPPGEYDFAFRFSGDSGATFTYCDGDNAGSSDGYEIASAGQLTSTAAPPPANMYFSEYVEGSSNNKAIEIYNADDEAGNLDNCVLNIYFAPNSTVGNAVDLSGTLGPGERYVVCDDGFAQPDLCDVLATGNFWNGDDSVELRCGTTTLDVFGQIGADPGDEWLAGGVGTQNETLRRDCLVTTGDNDGSDAFDPSAQWDTFAQDTFDDLGFHDCG